MPLYLATVGCGMIHNFGTGCRLPLANLHRYAYARSLGPASPTHPHPGLPGA